MAQMLAPYNNAMRLGQGFNSYTQQICLDRAVMPDPDQPAVSRQSIVLRSRSILLNPQKQQQQQLEEDVVPPKEIGEGGEEEVDDALQVIKKTAKEPEPTSSEEKKKKEERTIEVYPWVKPQIVTYSSHFVDKLSDVTDAMNISGSLSIKTAQIGGKASGSYIDSDKFKSSDINFHLQVRVTNQIHDAKNYSIFNQIDGLDAKRFPEVYGDSFISGWEEGGELNAIVSVKVLDKSKIFQVKAAIEAELTTPSIAGKVEAKVDIEKKNLSKDTETTVTVNWSGGGSIKDPMDDWSMESLKAAAAAFPELVAITPQRTYAILTKYTALEDFHKKNRTFDVLSYENAGIYTGSLLDSFMDYKMLWKQISNATYELEGNRATIDMGEVSDEMARLATVKAYPMKDKKTPASRALTGDSAKDASAGGSAKDAVLPGSDKDDDDDEIETIPPFSASFAGLIQAKRICRFEMAKIVKEVDAVAKNPLLATDGNRDSFFLNPLVFKQLLPIVRSLSPENAVLGVRDPSATLLLGYSQPRTDIKALPPVYKLEKSLSEHCNKLVKSIESVAYKARDYRMDGCVGPISNDDVQSQAEVFNDLSKLDQTYRPVNLAVWSEEALFKGMKMTYANGNIIEHGVCEGAASRVLALQPNGSEVIVEVVVREATRTKTDSTDKTPVKPFIHSIAVATSLYQTLDTAKPVTKDDDSTTTISDAAANLNITSTTWLKPEDTRYSLRGFFGLQHPKKSPIYTLGVVWGKDGFVPVPTNRIQPSICKSFLGLSKDLQNNIEQLPRPYAETFLMGNSIHVSSNNTTTTVSTTTPLKSFNALQDIDLNWEIKALGFATNNKDNLGGLCGLKVTYRNGDELVHGHYTKEAVAWETDVHPQLSVVRFTAGRERAEQPLYIDKVEFVAGEEKSDSLLPDWPRNLKSDRFEGVGGDVSMDVTELVESAPNTNFGNGYARWSARGFYGEYDETKQLITRLGIVWGRG